MTVTPVMVGIALGRPDPLTDAESAQWQMWIDDAYMLIASRAADLGVVDPLPPVEKVDYVVREAVVAHIHRPDGATQVTISVNDASTSKSYRTSTGRVTILDEWWSFLGLTAPSGGAFSIDVIGTAVIHADICSLNFGALYCSCGADIAGFPLWEV